MMLRARFLLLLCSLCLSACQSLPSLDSQQQGDVFSAGERGDSYLEAVRADVWRIQGAFSFVNEVESGQGKVFWQNTLNGREVRLLGPFGAGAVRLIDDGQGASLSQGKKVWQDVSVEALLSRVLNWRMPIDSLSYWVFGLPDEAYGGKHQLDAAGRIQRLEQTGWVIEFKNYQLYPGIERELPRKIFAQHIASNTRVRLVVTKWLLGQK